jgi:hypothetical protein
MEQGYGGQFGLIKFTPLSTPQRIGTNTIWDIPRFVNVTNGLFSVNLAGGVYTADAGAPNKTIQILVPPNDTNVWQFNDCAMLASNLDQFAYGSVFTFIVTNVSVAGTGGSSSNAVYASVAGALADGASAGSITSTGTITATEFSGDLAGNASSADLATWSDRALSLYDGLYGDPALTVVQGTNITAAAGVRFAGDGSGLTNLALGVLGTADALPFVTLYSNKTFAIAGNMVSVPASQTAGIQEAINALAASYGTNRSSGGTIFFSPGQYLVVTNIFTPPQPSNVWHLAFQGSGEVSSGITYAGSSNQNVITIGSKVAAEKIVFSMRDMWVSSRMNMTNSLVLLNGSTTNGFDIPWYSIPKANVDRCWFYAGDMPFFTGLDSVTNAGLIGINVDCTLDDNIAIRNCEFASLACAISLAADHAVVEANDFEQCGNNKGPSLWPSSSPYSMGATILLKEPSTSVFYNGNKELVFAFNNFIGSGLFFACVYPFDEATAGGWPFQNAITVWQCSDEGSGYETANGIWAATTGPRLCFVNHKGWTHPYDPVPAFLITNTADYSTWKTVPVPTNLVTSVNFTWGTNSGPFAFGGKVTFNGGADFPSTNTFASLVITSAVIQSISGGLSGTNIQAGTLSSNAFDAGTSLRFSSTNTGYASNAGHASTADLVLGNTWIGKLVGTGSDSGRIPYIGDSAPWTLAEDAALWYDDQSLRLVAPAFAGDGSALTALTAANIKTGTAPISITGSATYATTAGTATNVMGGTVSATTLTVLSNGVPVFTVTTNGRVQIGPGTNISFNGASGGISASNITLYYGGIISAAGNLFVKAATASVLYLGNPDGTPLAVGSGSAVLTGFLTVQSPGPTFATLQLKQYANQTANLIEWQNPSGTVMGYVSSNVSIVVPGSITATNGFGVLGTNAAPSNVTIGVTTPDNWIAFTNTDGVKMFTPAWKNH